MDPWREGDVLIDCAWERVWSLKDHADLSSEVRHWQRRAADTDAIHQNCAFQSEVANAIIHPIDASEESALPAAARSDERTNFAFLKVECDVFNNLMRAVPTGEVRQFDGVL